MNDIWQALAHPARRRVLAALRAGSMSAGDLGELFDFSGATLSGHLKVLREADLVSYDREGTRRIYRLNLSVAEDALAGLLDLLRTGEARQDAGLGDTE